MEAIKALVIILGFAILVASLIGIWLSIGVLGSDFITGLIFLGVSIGFVIIGIVWSWYAIKHFV
jgi:hypothetical protein